MKIRKATTNDLDQLTDLFNQYRVFYKKSSDISAGKEFLKERMVNNESEIFVALNEEDNFTGFVQLYPIFSSTRMKRLWLLNDLFVAPSYRGQGIGVQFFEQREAHARAVGASVALFSSVIRALDHQCRPVGYNPLDHFWRKRGYAVVDGLICSLSWKEIGEAKETMKPMQFWMKRLPS